MTSEAFVLDGFSVIEKYRIPTSVKDDLQSHYDTPLFSEDAYGIVASHPPSKRRGYYTRGTPFEMGYLIGYLGEKHGKHVSLMCTDYIRHTPVAFLSFRLDTSLESKPILDAIVTWILKIYEKILVSHTFEIYMTTVKKEIPAELNEEMAGVYYGAINANPKTEATFQRIVALNISLSYLTALVYSGKIFDILKQEAAKIEKKHPRIYHFVTKKLKAHHIRVPDFCDGFYMKDGALKSGRGRIYTRDYQLQNARVWQKTNAMIIYDPVLSPNSKYRYPLVSVAAPGYVGSFTIMNIQGLALGLDMVRSSDVDPDNPGFGFLLLLRYIGHVSKNVKEAKSQFANAKRGTVWVYHMGDAKGKACVGEGGTTKNFRGKKKETLIANYVRHEVNERDKSLVPSIKFIKDHSHVDYRKGMWFRDLNYKYPTAYLKYNKKLIGSIGKITVPLELFRKYPEFFNFSYTVSIKTRKKSMFRAAQVKHLATFDALDMYKNMDFTSKDGYVFPSYEIENAVQKYVQNRYFPPLRQKTNQYLVYSNQWVIPEARMTQMSTIANLVASTADAIQWRYDQLNREILDNYGNHDTETAKNIITMLSPWKRPDYPLIARQYGLKVTASNKALQKNNADQAQIEGALSVCDLEKVVMETKSGYWNQAWLSCTLKNYIVMTDF